MAHSKFPRSQIARRSHPRWQPLLRELRSNGLLRELDETLHAGVLGRAPVAGDLPNLIAAHYDARGDRIERAWRSQADRYLEIPDQPLDPRVLVASVQAIVPEYALGIGRLQEGLDLRLADDPSQLESTNARVVLRRMSRHARSGIVRPEMMYALEPRSFVYALNMLYDAKGVSERFVPLAFVEGRRAWLQADLDRAHRLDRAGAIDPLEPWREFTRWSGQLAIAS